jgi:hypothetical protein
MIRAATHTRFGGSGKSPWTKLNDFQPNSIFESLDDAGLSEIDREKYPMIIDYAWDLFDLTIEEDLGGLQSQAVVYFGFMVHLEGWFNEVDNEDAFNKHMDSALELAEVFERYGAVVTFEASPETIEACGAWENILLELLEHGHGIGVHADRGFSQNPNYNLQLFTKELTDMKENAESLGLTIKHVSGICSTMDWAKAAIDAGYEFTTGGVGFCAGSMPEELRPDEYKSCSNPAECHGNMPLEMRGRIHPWKVNTAIGDWTKHDPNGELVILSSDSGIKNLYEVSLDPSASHGDMEYTDEDIVVLIEKVEEAISLAIPGKVNQIYFSLSIGAADVDEVFYSRMFEALQPFVDEGKLKYKSLNEIYNEYILLE